MNYTPMMKCSVAACLLFAGFVTTATAQSPATNPPTTVSSYTAWDFQASYTVSKATANGLWSYLNGAKITVGVTNVFNRMPPSAPLSQSFTKGNNNGVDVATYSPIGRLFFVSASVKF